MIHLPIVCFQPEARPDMREAARILARMADDAVGLRNSLGYIDFADLRALGWTRAQLEEHGRAASNDAVRRIAMAVDPFGSLSDDDYGRVCIMAATLPAEIDLADETAVMLHLSRARFAAIEIARLLTHAIAKARELRSAANVWFASKEDKEERSA
jgi:hypothetical protein